MGEIPPTYRFSVSEFTTMPWTFEQDVDHYAQLAVPGIEVCEIKLKTNDYGPQLDLLAEKELTISSVQPVIRTLFPSRMQPGPKEIPERMRRFRETIARFGGRSRAVPFITNTGIAPDGNIQDVIRTAIHQYAELSDYAAQYGALIALEPLNPTIMNEETAVWLIEQGMQIVEGVNRPNFGLCIDFWNIFQNPDVENAIRNVGDRIFIAQVSDWQTPRSFADRYIVGDGEIDFPPLLRACSDAGYRGFYELEIFSENVPDALWQQNLDNVITKSWAGLDRAWQQTFRAAKQP